nr:glucose-methanol-choline oxidoreductase, FAD/NAD(P)-binding domain protein [Tanacetum cinerariifolium]
LAAGSLRACLPGNGVRIVPPVRVPAQKALVVYRTKEDDVYKISTSVFITNFPESCSAKELFQSCKQYGHVVDTFIPNKRSKTGRRFEFVHFINVFNEERLVNNLCTVWTNRFKLHANIARFHRTPLNEKKSMPKKAGGVKKHIGVNEVGNSYVLMVKGQMQPENKESEATPTLVLSDDCLLSKDLSKSLFGRVKQFASLASIRKAVSNEGFDDIKIQYMGELWVLLEFISVDSMKLFQDNVGIGSWFSQLKQASMEFNTEGRIAWVEVEGIPFKLWSDNTFKRITTKWGELLDIDDQDEMCFHLKRLCIYTKSEKNIFEEFKIIFRGRAFWIHAKEAPGWVLDFMKENDDEEQNDDEGTDVVGMYAEESRSDNIVNLSDHNAKEANNTFSGKCPKKNSKEDVLNSVCSGHFKTSMVPSYRWINSEFDERTGEGRASHGIQDGWVDSVGNSEGILCVWDPNFFRKSSATVFDYFIMIRGVWRQTGNDLLIIAIYAPPDLKDKQMLWDYLTYEIGANVFNSFITNAGLEEVPLGGSSFTWCHKSATNMSKLDKFLISKNLLNTCSNITAITLERYLSDHRPILLRESHFDYGPTPFRFFHHWIEMEGFSKVVEDAWREGPSKYKYELEALKAIINKGDGNVEVVNKRMEVVNTLQKIDKICSSEMAQKAKVKWSIEGDENTSFFHGMLNKKQSLLNIQGIMVDGMWIESPNRVKGDFFHHFSSRFNKPDARRGHIEMRYPKTLTCDQHVELESDVSNEEIKRAVWDCEIDKSPGPDGFTFGFYRINTSKSKVMGVLVDSDKVKCAASKLGCLILKTPFSYLGSKGRIYVSGSYLELGDFSVASVRKVIDDKSLSEVDSKTRWIKYVPIKVNVHAWKVKTDSLPTRFNVSRRGIDIDSIMCAICDKGAETSSHLFFSCCMARQTVRMITRWWDVPYGEVDSYEDWINWFAKLCLSYKHKQMLEDRNLSQLGRMTPKVNAATNGGVKYTTKCRDKGGKMCSNTLAMIKNFTDTNDTKSKLKEDKEEEKKANAWPEWLTKRDKKKSHSGGTIPDVTGHRLVVRTGKYTTVKPKQATEGVTPSLQQTIVVLPPNTTLQTMDVAVLHGFRLCRLFGWRCVEVSRSQ